MRVGKRRGELALLAILTVACQGSRGPATPDEPGGASTVLQLELTVNDAKLGAFACDGPLFLTARVSNTAAIPVRLLKYTVRYVPTAGPCRPQASSISPELSLSVGPGERALVRRFDAAGELCSQGLGTLGCSWRATAELASDAGTADDEVTFATYSPASLPGCDTPPRVVSPEDGATLSGTVEVEATIVEGGYCVNSARSIVEAFDGRGVLAFRSAELDLGDRFHWNTAATPNGRYWLVAYQNCCERRGAPVVVTVAN